MSTHHTLKSVVKRGTMFGAVFALVAATLLPSVSVYADALNPLTERSLMLSSSAPGFTDTDGSGNSAGSPNSVGENYAPAGSGPNGKKTGQTYSFKVSSEATIKAFTFQYCTTAAGKCRSPGNNDPTPSVADDGVDGDADEDRDGDADLDKADDNSRVPNATAWGQSRSDLNVTPGFTQGAANDPPAAGEFQVYIDPPGVGARALSGQQWTFATKNVESLDHSETLTGQNNYITLKSTTGNLIEAGAVVDIVFKASENIYITNPGAGAFFVKLNTYDTDTDADIVPGGVHNIDGGVTVANVMTDSIHITTKVLETMSFSVGTRNRDLVQLNCADPNDPASEAAGCEAVSNATHGTCDPVQNVNANRLNLGNPDAEYSLETGRAWDVNSYWRLSSNSSGGATVYYSGDTLRNTVGDKIKDITAETISTPGTEQFGLGFVAPELPADGGIGNEYFDQYPSAFVDSRPFVTLKTGQTDPQIFPALQDAADEYDEATGTIFTGNGQAGTAKFKFLESSLTTPEPIAQQNTSVIRCATAKMRYVGNIAADTPAGVYTTKINYLAAPQY
jgi:hypothetical protein